MTLYCGNVIIVISLMSTVAGRTKWSYLVTLEGQPLCCGEDLETHASRSEEEAAAELIGFIMNSEEEQQREWGWEPIDQEKLREDLNLLSGACDIGYRITGKPTFSGSELEDKYGLKHCPNCGSGLCDPVEEISELIEYDHENEKHDEELPDGSPAVKFYCDECRVHFIMYVDDATKEDEQDAVDNNQG